jgi:hypothetical protein
VYDFANAFQAGYTWTGPATGQLET